MIRCLAGTDRSLIATLAGLIRDATHHLMHDADDDDSRLTVVDVQ